MKNINKEFFLLVLLSAHLDRFKFYQEWGFFLLQYIGGNKCIGLSATFDPVCDEYNFNVQIEIPIYLVAIFLPNTNTNIFGLNFFKDKINYEYIRVK